MRKPKTTQKKPSEALKFLKEIDKIDEEANAGVKAEEKKLAKEVDVEMKIEKLKSETKTEKLREIKQNKMDAKAMNALVTRAMGPKFLLPARQIIKSWKQPIDYLIDPSPKKVRWKKLSDRTKLYDRSYKTPVEGVLVTIYNPQPDRFFTVWDYSRIANAIHTIGVEDNIPMDKETRCFCKLVALPTVTNHPACVCTHPSLKVHQPTLAVKTDSTGSSTGSFKKAIVKATKEEKERHIEQSKKRVAEAKRKKSVEIDRRLYLLNKRLQQHRDGAEGKRELRLKDEMAALDNYGASFTLQDIRAKRAKFNATESTVQRPVAKNTQIVNIQREESDTRLMISALTMQRHEIIARIKEYSRINRMARDDLKKANESGVLFAEVVHKNALHKLNSFMREMNPFNFSTTMKYVEDTETVTPYNFSQNLSSTLEERYKREKSVKLPRLLEQMDGDTREVLMLWLVRKSKESFAEQENKTNARLDHDQFELDSREEEWRKANETRQDIVDKLEMSDEEYQKLLERVKKKQEEVVKAQIRLTHEKHEHQREQTRKEEYQKQREHEQASLEVKLREQYNKAEEEIKRNEQLRKRATEQAAKARVLGLERKPSVSIDITAQLNRLKIMHSKLEEGRKTLEREEERRKQRGPGGEEDELCALCKKEDEIFKLESEIVRVHQRMQTPKCVQQPGCIESLQFEITRLRQEVQRRRALLLEMISEAKENAKRYQDQIDDCQSKPNGGCPKQEEWQLRLQLKRVQDMLRRMEKRETERTIIRIYKCLYEHREVKQLKHPIDEMFGVPNARFATGCPKLEREMSKLPTTSGPVNGKSLYTCICSDYQKEQKMTNKVGSLVAKARAKESLDKATRKHNEDKKTLEKEERQEEAKEIEKDVIAEIIPFHPEVVRKGGSVDDVAKRALEMAKVTPGIDLKKIRDESVRRVQERHVGKTKKCPQGNECDKLNKAEKVSSDLLNKCLNDVNSEAIRANLRRAFQAGTKATGCALLSLASNPLLQQTHKCVCE